MNDAPVPSSPSRDDVVGSSRPRKRWLRRLLITVGMLVLVLLLTLLVLLLPMLLSTGMARGMIVARINQTIPGKVQIDSISLAWFSGQRIDGVRIFDPRGGPIIEVEKIAVPTYTLWAAITGGKALGPITVAVRRVNIEQYSDGSTNLSRALTRPAPLRPAPPPAPPAAGKPKALTIPADLKLKLNLTVGAITFVAPGSPKITVSDLTAQTEVVDPAHINATLHVKTQYDQQTGAVDGRASLTNLFDPQGNLQIAKADLDIHLQLAALPLPLVDACIGKSRIKLAELLGPTLSGDLSIKGALADHHTELTLNSAHAAVKIATTYADRTINAQTLTLHFTLTPQAGNALLNIAGQVPAVRLLQPVNIDFVAPQARLKLTEAYRPDLSATVAQGSLQISAVVLDTGDGAGQVALVGATSDITFDGPKSRLAVAFHSTARYAGKDGRLSLQGHVNHLPTPDGSVDVKKLTTALQAQIQDWPVSIADQLLGLKGLLAAALGPTLNATIALEGWYVPQQGGTFDLNMHSPIVTANLPATLAKDLTLTFRNDAVVTFLLTKQLARQYLASVNPLLQEAQSSSGPIKLTLFKDQVLIPLADPQPKKLALAGRLELGTLQMKRGPLGGTLAGLLRGFGASIQDREEFDATFTPLDFTMKNGVVQSGDLWMDTGDLRLGTQAHVYLTGKGAAPYGELLMAIPGDTLLIVPGTRGKIDPNALYTVGSYGPLAALQPDVGGLLANVIVPIVASTVGGGNGEIGAAIGLGVAIFEGLDKNKKSAVGGGTAHAPDWWAGATWPHRPKPVLPQDVPAAQAAQPQPANTQPPPPNPLNDLNSFLNQLRKQK